MGRRAHLVLRKNETAKAKMVHSLAKCDAVPTF